MAADVNRGPGDTRVLLAPGTSNTAYRWGMEGPDDVNLSLLSRPSVVRTTVPNGSFEQTNFLAALDLPLSTGATTPGGGGHGPLPGRGRGGGPQRPALGDLRRAAALGVWAPGRRPVARLVAAYGRPGEHTVAPVSDFYPPRQALEDAARAPAAALRRGPRPIVRSRAGQGAMLVDGDSFALPVAGQAGTGPGEPAFRLLGSVTRPSWLPRWPTGPGLWSPTATGGGPGTSFRTGQNYSPTSGPTSPCRRRP